jgi:D-methionine transport system permease protein
MTIPATFFAYLLGLPLGVLLVITAPGHIRPNATLNSALGTVVNFLRSIPFIILLVMLFDVTRLVMGSAIGTRAVIFPLFVSAFPYVARVVEGSLNEVDRGVIEAAESIGMSPVGIIFRVYLREGIPMLARAATITAISLIGATAMAGAVGAGGLGDFAIRYGHNRFMTDITWVTCAALVLLVCVVQIVGSLIAKLTTH